MAVSSAEAELGAAEVASQEVLAMMSLWKDVGENIRGNVIGDPQCSDSGRPTHVVGKGETLEHELVVGPRECGCNIEHGDSGNGCAE